MATDSLIRGPHLRHTGGGALELWRDDAMVRYFGRFDGEFRDRDALIVAYNDQHDNAPPDQPSSAAQREYDRREYDRCMADFDVESATPIPKEPCQLCRVRQQQLAAGTWTIRFRHCPYCAADWS